MGTAVDRIALKAAAKEQIRGNIGVLFVIYLIYFAASGILVVIPVGGAIADALIAGPVSISLILIYLGLTTGEKPKIQDLLKGFNSFVPAFLTLLLVGLFTWLWSLLLIVPGIIKGLSYSMSFYLLAENPDVSALEAINESKRIMEGHKMELFVLQLSFIPWTLLMAVTAGIAGIWVGPYMSATMANYYHYVRDSAPAAD